MLAAFSISARGEDAMIALTRRTVVAGLSASVAMPVSAATNWPDRPITIVQGFPAGSAVDVVARIMAEGLSKRLGVQVILESKPGAAGTLAAGQVARAASDGHTLLAIPSGHAVAEATHKKLSYRTIEDFGFISMTVEYPFVLVTYPDHPIRTVADLIGTARSRTTPLTYGSPGSGSLPHLSVELLGRMVNVQFQHVPYRGSTQTVSDLLGQRIDFAMDPPASYLQLIKDGQLRALAVSGASPYFALPD